MICSKCGKEIAEDLKFCPQCGEKIEKDLSEEVTTPSLDETESTQSTAEKSPAPVGFILGLVSIIAWLLPLVGYPVTICGIIFSSKELKSTNRTSHTLAIWGLVLSIVFLVFTLFNSLLGVILSLAGLMS